MNKLLPWQEKLLVDIEAYTSNPAELKVIMSGRRAGKSTIVAQWLDFITPLRLEQSTGTVFGQEYLTVQPIGGLHWNAMMEWMVETFGPSAEDGVWTPNMRWYANNSKFWFKESKDKDWFILRWS